MGILDKVLARLEEGIKSDKKDLPKINNVAEQTKQETDIVEYIMRRVSEVRASGSRLSQESIWMTNYAYLMGFDSVYFDTTSRQYRNIGKATSFNQRNALSVNKILPTTQRRQARLCKNIPRFEVRPDDASQEAKERARLEQQLAEDVFERERIQEKRLVMMTGLQQCGHYYMHPYWDSEAGDLLTAEDEGESPLDAGPDAQTSIETIYEPEGQLKVELVSPFEIFPDPLATNLEDAQWVIRAKVRKLDYFKKKYPKRGHLVTEEGPWLISIQNELRINTMTGQGPATTGAQIQMKDAAIEFTLYERPNRTNPKGRMIVSASGVLLEDATLDIDDIPFAKFDDMPVAGKYYPEAIITHLRPIQDQYNRLVSMRADWSNKLIAGKFIAHSSAQMTQETLNDESGEVVYHNTIKGYSEPHAMSIPVMPQYAYQEEEKLNEMFYDIAGEGEISRGILPAAGIPAIGMQLLLEQDETRVAIQTEQHEHAFGHLMQMCLKFLEKYVTNDRLLKIADQNAQYQIKPWTGDDLKSKHDIVCVRGSLAPASKATKRNDIMNMYQSGILGNPQDPQIQSQVLGALENGDVYNFWADLSLDMAQIQKSLLLIEKGIAPEVFEGDNHALHWKEKNKFRKSDKFEHMSPENQAILLADMEEHLKWLQKLSAPMFGMPPSAEQEMEQVNAVNELDGAVDEADAELDSLEAQSAAAQAPEEELNSLGGQ